jgi:hypothetical protein
MSTILKTYSSHMGQCIRLLFSLDSIRLADVINAALRDHLKLTSVRCSILASLIAVSAGLYTIYTNGEAYDNRFSSISKAMQSHDVVALFRSRSTDTPVPMSMILRSKIRLEKDGNVVQFRTDTEYVALEEM